MQSSVFIDAVHRGKLNFLREYDIMVSAERSVIVAICILSDKGEGAGGGGWSVFYFFVELDRCLG